MSGDGLNAAHLGAIQTEALIRRSRTCIHRLVIPHECCARQPARSQTLPTDLPTWTPGINLPGTNLCIDHRTSQPSSLTSTSSRFQPRPEPSPDSPQRIK
ncbi:hypothetical protein CRENBAI_006356 [Crenichthys baileyi]|uniref:Uncharacterized protein n=1 Tax=Crenichthys baileyi TaxID=28760 RepID=A0AAV9RL43_9TELE